MAKPNRLSVKIFSLRYVTSIVLLRPRFHRAENLLICERILLFISYLLIGMGRGPPLTNHRSDSINIFHFQMALWKRCNEYAPRNVFGHRTTGPWTSDPPWRGEVWVLTLDGSLCRVFRLDILTLRVPF